MTTQTEKEDLAARAFYCEEAAKALKEQQKLYKDLSAYLNTQKYFAEKEIQRKSFRED